MASSHPPKQWWGGGGGGGGGSDEISRIFFGHVNFPEMNEGISVYVGTESNNHEQGGGGVSYH